MLDMAMNSAVGEKTDKVKSAVVLFAVFYGGLKTLDIEEVAVGDGLGDLYKHLINDAYCADVRVSYLRVAHLTVGKADVKTRSSYSGKGIFGKKL